MSVTEGAAPSYDLLICTIPHRHGKLTGLLTELDRQITDGPPGVGVRAFYDNLEHTYGAKCQALMESSTADYVSWLDDDDLVAPDYLIRIMTVLKTQPDYVGFPVRWTQDGEPMIPVEHSLAYSGWENQPGKLIRDITQFNPIRRELALLGRWEGGNRADRRWGDEVRASGQCRTQVWIDEPMYYYRENLDDTFETDRAPWDGEIPPLPEYRWLTVLCPGQDPR